MRSLVTRINQPHMILKQETFIVGIQGGPTSTKMGVPESTEECIAARPHCGKEVLIWNVL